MGYKVYIYICMYVYTRVILYDKVFFGNSGRNVVQGGGGTAQGVPGVGLPPSLPPPPPVLYPPYG